MQIEDAKKWAESYLVVRKDVREALIKALRERANGCPFHYTKDELRKIYRFPSDLSDERLLRLLDRGILH